MTCATWPIVWPKDKPASCTDLHEAAAVTAAQQILWSRTGRMVGTCTITETYDLRTGTCYLPEPYGGVVTTRPHRDTTGAIFLEQRPIQVVHEVKVDGAVIDDWTLVGGMLSRSQPGGFRTGEIEVTYTWGTPIAVELWGLVSIAMGEVANELLQGMCGGTCKLPGRATSITRQGVTVTLGGLPEDENMLGLPVADQLIRTVNPTGKRMRARVFSPDVPAATRRRDAIPGATNIGGVSTLQLDDGIEGDPYVWRMTFPDASFLAGGIGTVEGVIVSEIGGPTVATWTPSINGATLTLTLTSCPAAGSYWTDVEVGGITYLRKTPWRVREDAGG